MTEMYETEKGKELEKWSKEAFERYKQKYVTYDDYCYDGLRKAFMMAIWEREQYLMDKYFKPPEGVSIMAPNMNKDGFVELESRIRAHLEYEKMQSEEIRLLYKKYPDIAKEISHEVLNNTAARNPTLFRGGIGR